MFEHLQTGDAIENTIAEGEARAVSGYTWARAVNVAPRGRIVERSILLPSRRDQSFDSTGRLHQHLKPFLALALCRVAYISAPVTTAGAVAS